MIVLIGLMHKCLTRESILQAIALKVFKGIPDSRQHTNDMPTVYIQLIPGSSTDGSSHWTKITSQLVFYFKHISMPNGDAISVHRDKYSNLQKRLHHVLRNQRFILQADRFSGAGIDPNFQGSLLTFFRIQALRLRPQKGFHG